VNVQAIEHQLLQRLVLPCPLTRRPWAPLLLPDTAEDGAGGYVITLDFVKEMLETFKDQKLIHRRFAFQILLQVGRWCQGWFGLAANHDVPLTCS
jgi:hypothetical protein